MPGKILRSVALPAEHGAWSLWLEPVLLAMLIAPSSTGIFIAILSLSSLLIRQPLKILLIDIRKRKMYRRTRQGFLFVFLYSGIAAAAVVTILSRADYNALLPLLPAYLVAAAVVWQFDVGGDSRAWLPEVLAAAVMAAFAVSICLAGGWLWYQAAAVGVILLARAVPAVIYVRARLRQIKTGNDALLTPMVLQTIALCAVLLLHWLALAPLLSAIAVFALLARVIYFLRFGAPVKPKIVGIQEVAIGLSYVLLVAAGYLLHI